ncbi:innexin inx2-like [Cherax quadricarinatus]|uniref:innexin inx2-like n=1 Tax=Cherax quadricarinatus TaxID=27406 RepID=UPI00387E374F
MYAVFNNVHKKYFKNIHTKDFHINNIIFSLHYKITIIFLLIFCILITQKQYFGDPIDCVVNDIDSKVMNLYCWILSTYTTSKDGKIKFYHKYYQWVALFLYFQIMMFYFPHYLWKILEGGKIKMLVSHLNNSIVDDTIKQNRIKYLINYFTLNLHSQNIYVYKFFGCEILNFVNVIGQIYLTNRFLGYKFLTYGTQVIASSTHMNELFPKVATCTLYKHGSSGSTEKIDSLCVLSLNIVNEKIFLFLYFWFIILAVCSVLGIIYRLATFVPIIRNTILVMKVHRRHRLSIKKISKKCKIGDWFFLYQLAKNMDSLIYEEFIQKLDLSLQR